MTDKEIIKALECCSKDDCDNCPNDFGNCYSNLAGYALNIIKRQQAEIEELDYKLGALLCYVTNSKLSKSTYSLFEMKTAVDDAITDDCNDAKSEAVKEFAERLLKKELESEYFSHIAFQALNFDTNKLLKELVGAK